jgi:hypothetical protein
MAGLKDILQGPAGSSSKTAATAIVTPYGGQSHVRTLSSVDADGAIVYREAVLSGRVNTWAIQDVKILNGRYSVTPVPGSLKYVEMLGALAKHEVAQKAKGGQAQGGESPEELGAEYFRYAAYTDGILFDVKGAPVITRGGQIEGDSITVSVQERKNFESVYANRESSLHAFMAERLVSQARDYAVSAGATGEGFSQKFSSPVRAVKKFMEGFEAYYKGMSNSRTLFLERVRGKNIVSLRGSIDLNTQMDESFKELSSSLAPLDDGVKNYILNHARLCLFLISLQVSSIMKKPHILSIQDSVFQHLPYLRFLKDNDGLFKIFEDEQLEILKKRLIQLEGSDLNYGVIESFLETGRELELPPALASFRDGLEGLQKAVSAAQGGLNGGKKYDWGIVAPETV